MAGMAGCDATAGAGDAGPHGSEGLFTRWTVLLAFGIALAGAVVYLPAFGGGFLLDDATGIWRAEHIASAASGDAPLWRAAAGGQRPVTDLSFAAQLRASGWERGGEPAPGPLRLGNIVIHAVAAAGLFFALLAFLSASGGRAVSRRGVLTTAAVGSLAWAVHPLPTQAVSYTVQRGESLMSALLILAVVAFALAGRSTGGWRRAAWLVVTAACVGLSMGAKPAVVLAPVVLLCADPVLFGEGWRGALRRWWFHLLTVGVVAVVAVWTGVLGGVLSTDFSDSKRVGFGFAAGAEGHSWWDHLVTSGPVIMHYLRLVFWPAELVLDYGWPVTDAAGLAIGWPALLSGAVLCALLGATLYGVVRGRAWALPGVVFFATLATTQSVIPVRDPAFEHRMYLPSAAVVALVIGSVGLMASRRSRAVRLTLMAAGIAVAGALAARAAVRNAQYAEPAGIAVADAEARPDNARAAYNASVALARIGGSSPASSAERLRRALAFADRAAALDRERPAYALQSGSLAYEVYELTGDRGALDRAAEAFGRAAALTPLDPGPAMSEGLTLAELGDETGAIDAFGRAFRIGVGATRFEAAYRAAGASIRLARTPGSAAIEAERAGEAEKAAVLYREAISHLEVARSWCARARSVAPDGDDRLTRRSGEVSRLLNFARRGLGRTDP